MRGGGVGRGGAQRSARAGAPQAAEVVGPGCPRLAGVRRCGRPSGVVSGSAGWTG